ncbi:uncharacterized protein LOC132921056 isoform X1 [Rhopalosiphum padi]|uniref:uncharacterized protein LOC132921056 isoform X1 n=2 Tax=Rhopalosiphum padi TaxID=40932 RepID=UPI00298DB2AB|nr:uncharacterized protein LOC132921056 isoform X1 [Rhopalosiphum padi]
MNRCPVMNPQYDVERQSRCPAAAVPKPSPDTDDLHAFERIVVMFVQLKNYLGSYWLVPWFFVYIYPSVLVYESYGFVGPFVYCNIVQILFFIVFEFWDESFNWTPLHDTIKTYSSQILGHHHITKSVDEMILFCIWVLSWAAVPSICYANEHIFELPIDRLERLTSYVSMMTVTFVMAYIIILLWIDMNLLELKSNINEHNTNSKVSSCNYELMDDLIEPDDIPDLETVFEDISITNEFKIDKAFMDFSEAVNENIIESEEFRNCTTVEQGEEAKEQEMDVISLSSSTLSDFDVITEEEIDLLKNHLIPP